MTRQEIETRLIAISRNQLASKFEITLKSNFVEDFQMDSLDIAMLVMLFEKEFDLEIQSEDYQKISTLENAIDYIESKLLKSKMSLEKNIILIISKQAKIDECKINLEDNLVSDLNMGEEDINIIIQKIQKYTNINLPNIAKKELTVYKLIQEILNRII